MGRGPSPAAPAEGAPREIECKLDVAAGDVAALRAEIVGGLGTPEAMRHLVSVYFDTRRQALRRHGVSLRLRADGARRIQTVKRAAAAGSGLFDRDAWEAEVAGETPDLVAAAATPVLAILAAEDAPLA